MPVFKGEGGGRNKECMRAGEAAGLERVWGRVEQGFRRAAEGWRARGEGRSGKGENSLLGEGSEPAWNGE